MTTKIFYKETGNDKTTYRFFELMKETNSFYTLMPIGKHQLKDGVYPNRLQVTGEEIRVKKTQLLIEWNGETLKENNNYTYTGA